MRIASDSIYSNVLRNIQRNQTDLDRLNQQISSGVQFRFPNEEPVKAVQSMRLRTDIEKSKKYSENISDARAIMEATDAALGNAVELLQRARELSIQAANATLTPSDRANIGFEINQVLEEMISIGNSEFNGKYIFGGSETLNGDFNEKPFEVERTGGYIMKVRYKGDTHERLREISEGLFMATNLPGNRAFAGSNHSITMGLATVTTTIQDDGVEKGVTMTGGFRTGTNATLDAVVGVNSGYFRVDGKEIYYDTEVDSLQDIADRINQANLEVQASIVTKTASGTTSYRLKLETTNPHQMSLTDVDRIGSTGTVEGLLDDLQIVEGGDYVSTEPNHLDNTASTADEQYASVYQALINLRDDMNTDVGRMNPNMDFFNRYAEDTDNDGVLDTITENSIVRAPARIGGSSLANLDSALDNVLVSRAVYGARVNRLDSTEGRNIDFEQNTTQLLQQVEDIDFAETLIQFQQLQNIQQAALSTGAKIFSLTLLDFM